MGNLYNTHHLNLEDQFDYWREELCHVFIELTPERFTTGNFNGSIYQQLLTEVSVSRVVADPHCVNRTPTEISRSSEECYFANLQLRGVGRTHQEGEEIVTRPGDLVLVDARKPYDIQHHQNFDLISVKIPCDLLKSELKLMNHKSVVYVPVEHGYAGLLRSYTTSLLDDYNDGFIDTTSLLADNLVNLISISLYTSVTNVGLSKLPRQQYSRLLEILGYINSHLRDPSLNIHQVAEHFRLSPRYIQKLFAATGNTFSKVVLQHRLVKCAGCLRSTEYSNTKLSEIAFAWGLNDVSYFSRSFKEMFGATPRDYKKNFQHSPPDSSSAQTKTGDI